MSNPIVVVKLPRSKEGTLTCLLAIHQHCTNSSLVKVPSAMLDKLADETKAYQASCTKAATHATGTSSECKAARQKVKETVGHIRDIVQSAAEAQPSLKDAIAAIESTYMHVRKVGVRATPEITVENTVTPGTVRVIAKSPGSETMFFWQYSQDQQTWTNVPVTLKTRRMISGLPSGTRFYFRYRTVRKEIESGYSDVASLIVQ